MDRRTRRCPCERATGSATCQGHARVLEPSERVACPRVSVSRLAKADTPFASSGGHRLPLPSPRRGLGATADALLGLASRLLLGCLLPQFVQHFLEEFDHSLPLRAGARTPFLGV